MRFAQGKNVRNSKRTTLVVWPSLVAAFGLQDVHVPFFMTLDDTHDTSDAETLIYDQRTSIFENV